jgi:hypothetical protein
MGKLGRFALAVGLGLGLAGQARGDMPIDLAAVPSAEAEEQVVELQDVSLDRPLVLDENVDYVLRNVTVTGVNDCAAITLTGRIKSVMLDKCTFGKVWTGLDGKAAGIECVGAVVGKLVATDTTFFDAENQLATLREGSFGKVTFERCRFATSDSFLRRIYQANPWRSTPPVTEFYNIERLELLDNTYSNTLVVIHPSVKQVIVRGAMPGLKIENPQSTQLIQLEAGERAEAVPPPGGGVVAAMQADEKPAKV